MTERGTLISDEAYDGHGYMDVRLTMVDETNLADDCDDRRDDDRPARSSQGIPRAIPPG
jgi:hypothetical protein